MSLMKKGGYCLILNEKLKIQMTNGKQKGATWKFIFFWISVLGGGIFLRFESDPFL